MCECRRKTLWEVGGWAVGRGKSVRTVGWVQKTLVSVELVAKMEDEACRLAKETAGGGEGEVRCDEKVVDVFVVNFAGDCMVVAGRASVAEDGSLVGGGLHEAEDGSVDRGIGGTQVVEGKVVLGGGEDFDQVKFRVRGVADSNNRARNELGRRE